MSDVHIDEFIFVCQATRMTKRQNFHHGNLRAVLLEAGHRALDKNGIDKLSIRGLAAEASVAPSAPYNHFKNKNVLIQALVNDGTKEIFLAYQKASKLNASPEQRLKIACNAYLDFADKRPGLFKLIFESESGLESLGIKQSESESYSNLFLKMVVDTVPNLKKEDQQAANTACWSMIHGYATLRNHGFITPNDPEEKLRNSIIDAAIEVPKNLI